MKQPELIAAERWVGDLAWLYEIPLAERPHWHLAPVEMTWTQAEDYARQIGADKFIRISTGETLVRLLEEGRA